MMRFRYSCLFLLLLHVATTRLVTTRIFASALSNNNRPINRVYNDRGIRTDDSALSRRDVFGSVVNIAAIISVWPSIALSIEEEEASSSSTSPLATAADNNNVYQYENRDRKSNKDALVREDYWFMMGKSPPRLLNGPLKADNPDFNAFGSCKTAQDKSSNSCTYVSLKQRVPIYSKYAFNIALGAKEYTMLGKSLQNGNWKDAENILLGAPNQPPPPPIDALLKMVLFASGMLTSPNFTGLSKRLLVARYYANEIKFAIDEIKDAIDERDTTRAKEAWKYGKDSWNSYYQIVNDSVSDKVGDKFDLIA
jgi:hypothetical protein